MNHKNDNTTSNVCGIRNNKIRDYKNIGSHYNDNSSNVEMLKSYEYSNCHEPLSQEWINGRYQTSKLYVT